MTIILGIYVCLLLFNLKYNKTKQQSFEITEEVTVIIPFRNEEDKLPFLLNSLKKEWKAEYGEILFVDDHSSDRSSDLIRSYDIDNMQLLSLKDGEGKKQALKLGLKNADFKNIAQLDADVILSENYFEKLIVQGSDYTSGLIKYKEAKGGIALFQKWENLAMMFTSRLAIQINIPLMSNGANSNYKLNNVDYNDSYTSGDDLFNMYSIFKSGGNISFNDQTWIETNSAPDFRSFINQRLRWMKKSGGLNDWKFRALSVLFLFSQISPFLLLINPSIEMTVLVVLKTLLELQGMMNINKILRYKGLFPFYFVMLLLYPISIIFLLLISLFSSVSWKGRVV